jgi:hypothetical protein
MIDPAAGEVRLPLADVVLGPRLTRESFLASGLGEHARSLAVDEPCRVYVLSVPAGELGEMSFDLTLQFDGPTLVSLGLRVVDARFGTSWSDWTEAKEQDRRRHHDDWLAGTCGLGPGQYPWGRLESGFDPKGGFSSIVLRYS